MKLWSLFFGEPGAAQPESPSSPGLGINPANGLPLIDGTNIDVEGNPCGMETDAFSQQGDWPFSSE